MALLEQGAVFPVVERLSIDACRFFNFGYLIPRCPATPAGGEARPRHRRRQGALPDDREPSRGRPAVQGHVHRRRRSSAKEVHLEMGPTLYNRLIESSRHGTDKND